MADHMKIEVDGQIIEMEVVTVGPELASIWLERNRNNRGIRRINQARINRAMEIDTFKFVGDPIRFSKRGDLIDGQHRLKGIIATGTEQQILVMRGFDDDAVLFIDQGSNRQGGDQLAIAKVTKSNTNDWASIARLAIRWDAGDILSNILVVGNPEVVAFCEEHHEAMQRAVAAARAQYKRIKIRVSIAGAVHFFAEEIDRDLCAKFFRGLAHGNDLHSNDPVFVLRNTMLERKQRDRFTLNEELSLVVRAWNGTRKGQSFQRLQLPREGLKPVNFELK